VISRKGNYEVSILVRIYPDQIFFFFFFFFFFFLSFSSLFFFFFFFFFPFFLWIHYSGEEKDNDSQRAERSSPQPAIPAHLISTGYFQLAGAEDDVQQLEDGSDTITHQVLDAQKGDTGSPPEVRR